MIRRMSLSSVRGLAIVLLVACGGTTKGSDEPQTAKEKQLREAKASGEIDSDKDKKWGTWRYAGDRNDCFYVVGRKCFKSKVAACSSLSCKNNKKCSVVGGGPATVSCK